MNKKVKETNEGFHLALIIGMYLVIDIILLFGLCVLELKGITSHRNIVMISFVIEFLSMLIVALKGNIKSGIVYYIILLVSPVFLGLLAMSMSFVTDKMPFTPTVLVLFRFGYDLKGVLLNNVMRGLIVFRSSALASLLICVIINLISKSKKIENK